MMKKALISTAVLLLAILAFACSSPPVQDELKDYAQFEVIDFDAIKIGEETSDIIGVYRDPILESLEYSDFEIVRSRSKFGVLDKHGNEILPFIYDGIMQDIPGLFMVILDNKYGLIDFQGNTRAEIEYDFLSGVEGRPIIVNKADKWGFIDITGEIVIPLIYEFANPFNGPVTEVILDGNLGYIDRLGKLTLLDPRYDTWPVPSQDGLILISVEGKYGFINEHGEVVIPLIYDRAYSYGNGTYAVDKLVGKYMVHYVIDKESNIIMESKDYAFSLRGEMYVGIRDHYNRTYPDNLHREALLDSNGNLLTGFDYVWIGDFVNGVAEYHKILNVDPFEQHAGIMNKYGEEIK